VTVYDAPFVFVSRMLTEIGLTVQTNEVHSATHLAMFSVVGSAVHTVRPGSFW
jgi:hypothetical protein